MMKVKFDILLNFKFEALEQAIFYTVLLGYRDVSIIKQYLNIFDDDVIAVAIRNLVNKQLLTANFAELSLGISEPMKLLISKCSNNSFEIDLPEIIDIQIRTQGYSDQIYDKKIVYSILANLSEDADLTYYSNYLGVVVKK
ncbi:MAG: hypothetical protein AB9888_07950 [Bacteroidales bacterium]